MRLFAVLSASVLALHCVWILWVLFGWLLTKSRPWLAGLHVASLCWGIVVEIGPWPCPLTLLEQWLELRAGDISYQGSFIMHYMGALVYPNVPRLLLTWFGPAVCVAILSIHARRFWHAYHRRSAG